jgi:ketosteroid isomerase-like protein
VIDATPVRGLYDAFVARDFDRLATYLADDVHMDIAGRSRFAGHHTGRDAVVDFFRGISVLRPKIANGSDVCVSNVHAVMFDWFTANEKGREFLAYVAFICAVEDGRIARLFPFFDDQYAFDEFFA